MNPQELNVWGLKVGGGVRYGYRNQIDGYLLDRETERTEELKDSQVI